jgi:hypothetical protein
MPGVARAQHDSTPPGLREVHGGGWGRNNREGLWGAIGLGAGAESFNANDGLGWSDDKGGGLAYFKIGGTVSQSLLLGVEGQVWSTNYYWDNYDRSLSSLMAIAQVYPSARGAGWLKGGFGLAHDQLNLYGSSRPTYTGKTGTAFDLGLGYDFRVARNISASPSLDLVFQHYDTHDERLLNLGFALTFH